MPERAVRSREAPDWVKRLAPYIIAVPFACFGLALTLYIPPLSYASPWYIVFSLAVSLAIWLALGSDEIPGRAEGARRRRVIRLAGIPLIVGVLVAGNALGQVTNMASSFGWGFVAGAAKMLYTTGLHERLALCQKCKATRWFIEDKGEYYCPRCGTRLWEDTVTHAA